MLKIEIVQGDITKQEVEAVVNAVNKSLLGGGGVDGAIHQATGPQLLEECKTLGGCQPGEAKITKGYNLPAKYVIHTVGPIWSGGKKEEPKILRNCYLNSLKLAKKKGIKSIAFPAISCGVYCYPPKEAAKVAIKTIMNFIKKNPGLFEKVVLVLYTKELFEIYQKVYANLEK